MSTKETPGPFDGLERAKPGEPVFTLQGGDPLGARLTRIWVWQARKAVLRDTSLADEERAGKLIKIREAEAIAEDMEAYRAGHIEDAKPAEEKEVRYSGHTSTPEEIAAKAHHDTIKRAAERLHNSVAESLEAAASLEPYGFAGERAHIANLMDGIRLTAMQIQPKRASYAHRGAK